MRASKPYDCSVYCIEAASQVSASRVSVSKIIPAMATQLISRAHALTIKLGEACPRYRRNRVESACKMFNDNSVSFNKQSTSYIGYFGLT